MNSDATSPSSAPDLVGQVDRLVGQLLGIGEPLAQAVHRVFAVDAQRRDDRQVVHADDLEVEAAEVDVEDLRERELRAGDLVAQPDRLDRSSRASPPGTAWSSGS